MLKRNHLLGAGLCLAIAANFACWLAVAVIGIRARHGDYGLNIEIYWTFQHIVQAVAVLSAAFDVIISGLLCLTFMRLRKYVRDMDVPV